MNSVYDYISEYKTLSIIGMCKNAGKTTVLNNIIESLDKSQRLVGLTSIGRDGESVDLVTRTSKPSIYIREGTIIATAHDLLSKCDISREIVDKSDISTPLGNVIFVRAKSDGFVELAGPSITEQLKSVSKVFFSLGASMSIIDGALSRKTLCSPSVSEATVLCSGASYHKNMNVVIQDTVYNAELMGLKKCRDNIESDERLVVFDKDGQRLDMDVVEALKRKIPISRVFIGGAMTEGMMKNVLMQKIEGIEFVVRDSTKILIGAESYSKLKTRMAYISVLENTVLACITINPFSAYGYDFDKNEFMDKMREKTSVPVVNVLE